MKVAIVNQTKDYDKKHNRLRGNNDETCVVECKWASCLYEKGF